MEQFESQPVCINLQATLRIAIGKTATLRSCSGIFTLPSAECFDHLAEGEYKGIFDIIPLEPPHYRENDEITPISQAVVIDYHLETPEAARESPGFIVCFLEGFLENWNAPLPKQQKKRQDREKTSK